MNSLTNKKKTQAPMINQSTPDAIPGAVPLSTPVQESNPYSMPFEPCTQTPPAINSYTQKPQQLTMPTRRPASISKRNPQAKRPMRHQFNPPKLCWGCNQAGHIRENCPMNPWPHPK